MPEPILFTPPMHFIRVVGVLPSIVPVSEVSIGMRIVWFVSSVMSNVLSEVELLMTTATLSWTAPAPGLSTGGDSGQVVEPPAAKQTTPVALACTLLVRPGAKRLVRMRS